MGLKHTKTRTNVPVQYDILVRQMHVAATADTAQAAAPTNLMVLSEVGPLMTAAVFTDREHFESFFDALRSCGKLVWPDFTGEEKKDDNPTEPV